MFRKKISEKEAQQRFIDRTDIELIEFIGWTKKSKFWDKVINEEFWSKPIDVYQNKSSHPKRKQDKIRKTCLKRYGTNSSLQSNDVKEKIKNTNLEKYGVDNPFKSKSIKKRIKKTNLKKYGVDNPSKSNEIKKKKKQTNLKKRGVEYATQSKEVQEKTKKTNLEKYNTEYVFLDEAIKFKIKNTNLKKYGTSNPITNSKIKEKAKKTMLTRYGSECYFTSNEYREKFLIKNIHAKYFIKENNEPLYEFYKTIPEPKPALFTIQQNLTTYTVYKKEVLDIVNGYKTNKSNIEQVFESKFGYKHFGKKPNGIKKYYKPDFKLSSKTYLNVDGLYWHSDAAQEDKWYHFNLRKYFEDNELRIFQFREDEIRDKSQIVKSIINNSIGKTPNRNYARNCFIKPIKQGVANTFLKENHLMGTINAKHIGLFQDDTLVSVLSYKQRKNLCKIERFCSLINTSIVGGFSKMLSYLEKNCLKSKTTEIHNWVDLRYGTGRHLIDKGFVHERDTLGWKWTDRVYTYNRLKCRANMDERKLSMKEHAKEFGWYKIYDAGQRLYVKYYKQ